jgi:hypothetical protein
MHKRENEQIFLLNTSTHMLQLRKNYKKKDSHKTILYILYKS